MKKILLTLALVAMGASVYAQTTVNGRFQLYNRVIQDATINGGASRNEQIAITDAAAVAAGLSTDVNFATPQFSIGLFWKNAQGVYTLANLQGDGTTPSTTAGIGTFRADQTGANGGTMTGTMNVEIPGTAAGSPATFQVRAWLTSQGTYEQALVRGSSGDLTVAQLGGTTPANTLVPTPNLSGLGFRAFVIDVVPEPSTYALGIAGLGALALMRRRKQA